MKPLFGSLSWHRVCGGIGLATVIGLLLQACGSLAPQEGAPRPVAVPEVNSGKVQGQPSLARTPKEYRHDAARHLYARAPMKVYKGRLPPMLYAVGVLNVDIDRRGQIQSIQWMRAPKHAPEVMAEIEQIVRAAAPYPIPQHMTQVTYTDVWLWDKSGRFQLDTLTEGQD